MKKRISIVALLALLAALSGCARQPVPEETAGETIETTLSLQQTTEAPQEAAEGPQADRNQMRQDLDALTKSPRPVGSEGEQAAADYLKDRFESMGYAVTTQPYWDAQGHRGSNVIAVKEGTQSDGDILVLSAHHDTVPGVSGASDNASGVSALLAAAELLKDTQPTVELRFISFTDEETGKNGSRYYMESLSDEEKGRMIGCIQLDMLGGLGSQGTKVCTMDGQGNYLSDLLRELDSSLGLSAETASDHASFQLAGIPSVLLTQSGRGYLYHTAADKADQLDIEAIAQAAETAANAAGRIIGKKAPAYGRLARQQGRDYTYCQTRQNVIYFSASLADTESYIGAPGTLVSQEEQSGDGWTDRYDTYLYAMRWFNGKNPMNTYYRYRNGFLQDIEIRPYETGYSIDQVRSLLVAMYDQPTSTGNDREDRHFESWRDELYSKQITLTDDPEGFTVSVSNYSVGISNTLASYDVVKGQAKISDPKDAEVWQLLCSILPEANRQKITQFRLFTDGASNILAYTSPIREGTVTDNTRFSITVDYFDVYDEKGSPRDKSKLIYTLLHEYGHVLLEDETQIDLSVGESTHDPAGFIEGSFRKKFYDRFWADLGDSAVGDYEAHPSSYVSRYGANLFHEDIADTFAIFLLGGKPEGDTVAEEKILLFWEHPEMVELRREIRKNLDLPQ